MYNVPPSTIRVKNILIFLSEKMLRIKLGGLMRLFANVQLKSQQMTNSGSYWSDWLSDWLNETFFTTLMIYCKIKDTF